MQQMSAQGVPATGGYHGLMADERVPETALESALERIGERWALLLVDALLEGPKRFSDLQETVPGIAPNILSARLKHLEREAIVIARPYQQRPMRLSYELTSAGRELAGALRLLAQWGARGSGEAALRHATCGSPLEARWYCPTCARVVDDAEPAELRYL
jgi:DNA-binding HxlR family transcriptional regulator